MNLLKHILFLTLFATWINPLLAQTWERQYNLSLSDKGKALTKTKNGGYAVASETIVGNLTRISLLQVDEDGATIAHDLLTIDSLTNEFVRDMLVLPNGDFFILSQSFKMNAPQDDDIRLTRLNQNGEFLGTQIFGSDTTYENAHTIIPTSDGHFLLVGTVVHQDAEHKDALLIKIDEAGNILWSQTYGGDYSDIAKDAVETENGFIITGIGNGFDPEPDSLETGVLVLSVNLLGDLDTMYVWDLPEFDNSFGNAIVATADGGFAIAGEVDLNGAPTLNDGLILYLDSEANAIDFFRFGTDDCELFLDLVQTPDGGLGALGYTHVTGGVADVYLVRVDANRELLWWQVYGDTLDDHGRKMVLTDDGESFVIAGDYTNPTTENLQTYLIKTDHLGAVNTNLIQGTVFFDENENCTKEALETSNFSGRLVRATGDNSFYSITDEAGNFQFRIPSDDYTLSVLHPTNYWGSDCTNVPVTLNQDTILANLPATNLVDCPYLRVEIAAPFLRRCYDNTYTVYFENKGTTFAEAAYIKIELDDFQTVLDATLPFEMDGSSLIFQLGDVAVDASGSFQIFTNLSCDAVLGQAHCVEAQIFPDTICTPPSPVWDGSNVEIEARCEDDEFAIFKIVNTGDDMDDSLQYIVIEDALLLTQPQKFKIPSGDSVLITLPATGATYRVQAQQSEAHPSNNLIVSQHIEGCDADGDQEFSLGFVTLFEADDQEPYKSIDCQQNIGSFDPNDKRAFPVGLTEAHCIDTSTDLDYHIRFQNTGTDTAFRVVVRDTLSAFLDVSSIQFGAASHAYRVEILEGHILKFIFDNIQLPDSTANEVESHGFIRFKIRQQPDNQLGTVIENSAAIYFDFNEPVITNQVFHTIDDCFETFDFVPTSLVFKPNTQIEVFPNPAFDVVHFKIEGIASNNFEMEIYDVAGKFLSRHLFKNKGFSFEKNRLAPGIYFYKINAENEHIGTGKLIFQ